MWCLIYMTSPHLYLHYIYTRHRLTIMGIPQFGNVVANDIFPTLSCCPWPPPLPSSPSETKNGVSGLFVDSVSLLYRQVEARYKEIIDEARQPPLEDVLEVISETALQQLKQILIVQPASSSLSLIPIKTPTVKFDTCYLSFDLRSPSYKKCTQEKRELKNPKIVAAYKAVMHSLYAMLGQKVKCLCDDIGITYADATTMKFGEGENIAIWSANRWIERTNAATDAALLLEEHYFRRQPPTAYVCGVDWDIAIGVILSNYRLNINKEPGEVCFLKLPSKMVCHGGGSDFCNAPQIKVLRWTARSAEEVVRYMWTSFITGNDYFPGVTTGTTEQFIAAKKAFFDETRNNSIVLRSVFGPVFHEDINVNGETSNGEDDDDRSQNMKIMLKNFLKNCVGYVSPEILFPPGSGGGGEDANNWTEEEEKEKATLQKVEYEEVRTFCLRVVWFTLYHINTVFDYKATMFMDNDYEFTRFFGNARNEFRKLNNSIVPQNNTIDNPIQLKSAIQSFLYRVEKENYLYGSDYKGGASKLFDDCADAIFR